MEAGKQGRGCAGPALRVSTRACVHIACASMWRVHPHTSMCRHACSCPPTCVVHVHASVHGLVHVACCMCVLSICACICECIYVSCLCVPLHGSVFFTCMEVYALHMSCVVGACTHTQACTHMCAHMHTHACAHTCTHTYVCGPQAGLPEAWMSLQFKGCEMLWFPW